MNAPNKNIALMTTGGDCSGLNYTIKSIVVRAKLKYATEVIGLHHGTRALVDAEHLSYTRFNLSKILHCQAISAGSMIGSQSSGNPFHFKNDEGEYEDVSDRVIENYKALDCKGLILIGGDGSFSIMSRLAEQGDIPLIAIPKTIDNDIGFTENAIGFNTGLTQAVNAIDALHTTAMSHKRIMLVELMGKGTGTLALQAGLAGDADIILLPEFMVDPDKLIQKIDAVMKRVSKYCIIVLAEGVKDVEGSTFLKAHQDGSKRYAGAGQYYADLIAQKTKYEVRLTSLGHVQRGGDATPSDRLLGATLGVHAVDALMRDQRGKMLGWYQQKVIETPIEKVLSFEKRVVQKEVLVKTAKALGKML